MDLGLTSHEQRNLPCKQSSLVDLEYITEWRYGTIGVHSSRLSTFLQYRPLLFAENELQMKIYKHKLPTLPPPEGEEQQELMN